MLRRFAAASAVACIALAVASSVILVISGLSPQRFALLLAMWCIAPSVWGLWAMLAPSKWTPERLPVWGAMLGVVAGLMAAFVLDLPSRIAGFHVAVTARFLGLVVLTVFYFILWTFVRTVFKRLTALGS